MRELIMQSGDFVCYPYDINYVWMKGHENRLDDQLRYDDYRESNGEYIRNYLDRLNPVNEPKRVLEKTVSNSLRLDYVLRVLPDTQIVHLIRDGREVTASIKSCWTEPPHSTRNQNRSLLLKKILNFPYASATPYLIKYLKNSMPALFGGSGLKSWGPRFEGIDQMLGNCTLLEVCAQQWISSVTLASDSLNRVDRSSYIEIRYEDLVQSTERTIASVAEYIGATSVDKMQDWGMTNIRSASPKWSKLLTEYERATVLPMLEPHLTRLGYVN